MDTDSPGNLENFYASLLADDKPAILYAPAPLSAEALAMLLLPLPRVKADALSLAGWIPSTRIKLEELAKCWDGIVLPKDQARPLSEKATAQLPTAKKIAQALLANRPNDLAGLYDKLSVSLNEPLPLAQDTQESLPPTNKGGDDKGSTTLQRINWHGYPNAKSDLYPLPDDNIASQVIHQFCRQARRRDLIPELKRVFPNGLTEEYSPNTQKAIDLASQITDWATMIGSDLPKNVHELQSMVRTVFKQAQPKQQGLQQLQWHLIQIQVKCRVVLNANPLKNACFFKCHQLVC